MFAHLFAAMHNMLNALLARHPCATAAEQAREEEEVALLQAMSDRIMEEWLGFEERLALFLEKRSEVSATSMNATSVHAASKLKNPDAGKTDPCSNACADACADSTDLGWNPYTDAAAMEDVVLEKGKGFFHLMMFQHAAQVFDDLVQTQPHHDLARLFLAMCHMHLKQWHEAQRQFQLLIAFADNAKWRALGLNALGCIQAIRRNREQAIAYFEQACEADPTFEEPLSNLAACREKTESISLYFGSTQLSCL